MSRVIMRSSHYFPTFSLFSNCSTASFGVAAPQNGSTDWSRRLNSALCAPAIAVVDGAGRGAKAVGSGTGSTFSIEFLSDFQRVWFWLRHIGSDAGGRGCGGVGT